MLSSNGRDVKETTQENIFFKIDYDRASGLERNGGGFILEGWKIALYRKEIIS